MQLNFKILIYFWEAKEFFFLHKLYYNMPLIKHDENKHPTQTYFIKTILLLLNNQGNHEIYNLLSSDAKIC